MKPKILLVFGVMMWALAVVASEQPTPSRAASGGPKTLWGDEVGGWRVGAAVAYKTFAQGEPILVRAAVQNMSQAERRLRVERWGETQVWEVEAFGPRDVPLLGDAGKRVELTRLGRWLYGQGGGPPKSGSTMFARLGPGQQRSEIVQISDLVDMTMPGKYTVTIRTALWDHKDSQVTVESPPIDVEVAGRGGPRFGDPRYWRQIFVAGGNGLEPRSAYSVQQYARVTRTYVDDILRIATGEPQDEAGETARKELLELRTEIDAALGDDELPPESPKHAGEQPAGGP